MSYSDAKRRHEEQSSSESGGDGGSQRTDYRCAAHGCPNAGTIGGKFGVNRSGSCYYHNRAPLHEWPAVTAKIRANFDRMRNWGEPSAELQAEHREQAQRWAMRQSGRRVVNVPGNLAGIAPEPEANLDDLKLAAARRVAEYKWLAEAKA